MIWASFERTFIGIIIEELGVLNKDFLCVPLSIEHDGLLVYTEKQIPEEWVISVEVKLTNLNVELTGSQIPILLGSKEIKK